MVKDLFCDSSQDIGISAVVAFLLFCVAVSTAVYAGRFADYESNDAGVPSDILGDTGELNEVMGSVSVSVIIPCRL